jgi:hypothetical protein
MCFVRISEQTAIISLHSINWLDFYNQFEVCLRRTINWILKYNSGLCALLKEQNTGLLNQWETDVQSSSSIRQLIKEFSLYVEYD